MCSWGIHCVALGVDISINNSSNQPTLCYSWVRSNQLNHIWFRLNLFRYTLIGDFSSRPTSFTCHLPSKKTTVTDAIAYRNPTMAMVRSLLYHNHTSVFHPWYSFSLSGYRGELMVRDLPLQYRSRTEPPISELWRGRPAVRALHRGQSPLHVTASTTSSIAWDEEG